LKYESITFDLKENLVQFYDFLCQATHSSDNSWKILDLLDVIDNTSIQ